MAQPLPGLALCKPTPLNTGTVVCVVVFVWVVPLPLCRYLSVGACPVPTVYSLLPVYRLAAGISVVCLSISLWLMASRLWSVLLPSDVSSTVARVARE